MEEKCSVRAYEEKEDGCLVTFSDGRQLFFSYDEFYKYSLYDTEDGPGCSFDELMNKVHTDRAFSEGRRESLKSRKTSGEIRKLLKKEHPDEACEEAILQLKQEQYIDDRRYALFFVKKCANDKFYAKNMILREGKAKGLPEEEILFALENLGISDRETAERAAEKKNKEDKTNKTELGSVKEDFMKKKKKLASYLASKGFEFDLINEIVRLNDCSEGEYFD